VKDRDPQLAAHLAAVIVRGGKIISVGRNKSKMHVYTTYVAHHQNVASTHAEIDAIFRARKKIDLTGADMYVARVLRNGTCAMAAPCEMCQKVIRRYGIRRVFYTKENGYGFISFVGHDAV